MPSESMMRVMRLLDRENGFATRDRIKKAGRYLAVPSATLARLVDANLVAWDGCGYWLTRAGKREVERGGGDAN